VIKAFLNPLVMWIWIGAGIVLFGTLVALIPTQGKTQGTTTSSAALPREEVAMVSDASPGSLGAKSQLLDSSGGRNLET
jgi:cytochrome c-type biogenesis protein CcmF